MATEETRLEVYANAAGLLSRMGYHARVIPDYQRPPITGPVIALSTDVEGVLVGYAIAMVAENPETFLPTTRMPGGRIPGSTKGPPLGVWF